MNRNAPNSTTALIVGTIVFGMTLAAWLVAAGMKVDPGPLFYIAGPVVSALFLAPSIGKASDAAQQAATQTNGLMEARMEAAAATALAKRDAARTRQAQGDISEDVILPEPVLEVSPGDS